MYKYMTKGLNMSSYGKLIGLQIMICNGAFYVTKRGKGFAHKPWEFQNIRRVDTSLRTEWHEPNFSKI